MAGFVLLGSSLAGIDLARLNLRRFGPIESQEAASGWPTTTAVADGWRFRHKVL
jgi:hypothetical protein